MIEKQLKELRKKLERANTIKYEQERVDTALQAVPHSQWSLGTSKGGEIYIGNLGFALNIPSKELPKAIRELLLEALIAYKKSLQAELDSL